MNSAPRSVGVTLMVDRGKNVFAVVVDRTAHTFPIPPEDELTQYVNELKTHYIELADVILEVPVELFRALKDEIMAA